MGWIVLALTCTLFGSLIPTFVVELLMIDPAQKRLIHTTLRLVVVGNLIGLIFALFVLGLAR